jgi:RNA polymerase sigma factor (TIGR02999 family)
MSDVTRILSAIEQGDQHAAEQLLPLVYNELRKLAAQKLAYEKPGDTLDATALVHESYLRLVASTGQASPGGESGDSEPKWNSSGHFFAVAATAMRRILIDRARHKRAEKRGGGRRQQPVPNLAAPVPDEELLALDEALHKLATHDPIKARLVELRYFAGLTGEQAAEALGISPSTADRHRAYARAWLQAEVRGA